MSRKPLNPSVLAAVGLIGGFAVARYTGRRELGGALFGVAGLLGVREWAEAAGPGGAAAMTALYAAAMGGSHPLAKRLGAWPSVLAVTAVTVVASEVLTRRRIAS